jgi:hypothetical protein
MSAESPVAEALVILDLGDGEAGHQSLQEMSSAQHPTHLEEASGQPSVTERTWERKEKWTFFAKHDLFKP